MVEQRTFNPLVASSNLAPPTKIQGVSELLIPFLLIGSLDMMIGAHALSLGVTLATNNTREFSRIKGLTIVDWLDSSG